MKTFPYFALFLLMCTSMGICGCDSGSATNNMDNNNQDVINEDDIEDRVSTFDHFSELEAFRANKDIVNGDFETGDLTGWYKKDNTSAFSVINDEVDIWNNPVAKSGQYYLGYGASNSGNEGATGSIRSSLFKVEGSGRISFSLAGNCTPNLVCLIMVHNEDKEDEEILRFNNTRFSQGGLSGFILVPYIADLSAHLGKTCYFLLTDSATSNFAFISIDNIKTYYPEAGLTPVHFGSLASFETPKTKEDAINNSEIVDIEFSNTLKKEYNYNEEYSNDTLLVYGIYKNGVMAPLAKSEYVVNKSAFNKTKAGEYDIQVAVVGTTVVKSFKVKVNNQEEYRRGSKDKHENDELLVFGDSQMAMWNNLKSDIGVFKNVNNVAVGGSTTDDWLPKIDLLCTRKAPFALINLGGNDIRNRAKTPEYIAKNIETIIKKFKQNSPETHLYMYEVSCGPATVYNYWELAQKTIDLYKELEMKYDNFTVLGIKAQMMGEDGLPDLTKFREDRLHVAPSAYVHYARAFKEFIIEKE